jgi:hypothetical protein
MVRSVVLYPGLAFSHFVPVMLLIDPTLKQDIAFAAAVDHLASSRPSVTFHTLPTIPSPPTISYDAQFLLTYFDLVSRYTPHLHEFLCSLRPDSVHALVMDMLSIDALDAAEKLGIPAYTFFPSNASALATSIQISSTPAQGQRSFKELGDSPLDLHGVPSMPASHLFREMLESPDSEIYRSVTNMLRRIQEANGILLNSF